jgi:hypothetical protein
MEATATLRFVRPCLGSVRRPDYDRLQRDQDGNVIFLPTWWRASLAQAAKAISKYYKYVDQIHPGLTVEGTISMIKRWYAPKKYKLHEGFDVGTVIRASFLIPNELTLGEFAELLEAVGEYIGFSPYGWKDQYGLFRLLEVRQGGLNHQHPEGGQPSADHAGVSGHLGAGADVQASTAGRTERPRHDVRDDETVRGTGKA